MKKQDPQLQVSPGEPKDQRENRPDSPFPQEMETKVDTLYLAMELSNKTWKLGFGVQGRKKVKIIDVPAGSWENFDTAAVKASQYFKLENPPIVSCYEAGRDGFWIHRGLVVRGIKNTVVDSSSIKVDRRKRQAKTDKLDVKALLTNIKRAEREDEEKEFRPVHAPSPEDEDDRQLHREREALKKDRTSLTNTIRSLLVTQGIQLHAYDLPNDLGVLRDGNGNHLGQGLTTRLTRLLEHLELVDEQLDEIDQQQNERLKQAEDPKAQMIRLLVCLTGIGKISAWVLVMEVFGWRKFQNRKQAGAYPGFTPVPWSSGDLEREQGISKAGNARVRWLMVEVAWLWLRWQPHSRLSQWFRQRCPDGTTKRMRRISIVALARKLFIALWRLVTQGVAPVGARMAIPI